MVGFSECENGPFIRSLIHLDGEVEDEGLRKRVNWVGLAVIITDVLGLGRASHLIGDLDLNCALEDAVSDGRIENPVGLNGDFAEIDELERSVLSNILPPGTRALRVLSVIFSLHFFSFLLHFSERMVSNFFADELAIPDFLVGGTVVTFRVLSVAFRLLLLLRLGLSSHRLRKNLSGSSLISKRSLILEKGFVGGRVSGGVEFWGSFNAGGWLWLLVGGFNSASGKLGFLGWFPQAEEAIEIGSSSFNVVWAFSRNKTNVNCSSL